MLWRKRARMGLTSIDWMIMAAYSVSVVGIGVALQGLHEDQHRFFLAVAGDSGVGMRSGSYLRQFGSIGSHWHGRIVR